MSVDSHQALVLANRKIAQRTSGADDPGVAGQSAHMAESGVCLSEDVVCSGGICRIGRNRHHAREARRLITYGLKAAGVDID